MFLRPIFAALVLLSADFGNAADGPVDISQYPFIVSVNFFTAHLCTGVAISDTYVIAGNSACVGVFTDEVYQVRANLTVYAGNSSDTGTSTRAVYRNPNYNPVSRDYDIAILELNQPLALGQGVQPARLPDASFDLPEGTSLFTIGYEGFNSIAYQLQSFEVNLILNNECAEIYSDIINVTSRMVCTICRTDNCVYDFGSALVTSDGVLFGLLSFEAWSKTSVLYTRIPALRDFITQVTGI